jgi:hypothetical protein
LNTAPLGRQHDRARDELHRVATHVLARAQHAATGRFGLRVTPGGFGTASFGPDLDRLRVSDGLLVRETGAKPSPAMTTMRIDGSSLRGLAEFAGADLSVEFSAGHDAPPVGDVDENIALSDESARLIGDWYGIVAQALDRSVHDGPPRGAPSLVQLWPEHFDVALDIGFDPQAPDERRVNLGGTPGDGYHPAPYLYVGPWTSDRPGDPAFWNASFGALLDAGDVLGSSDPVASAAAFFRTGLEVLAR